MKKDEEALDGTISGMDKTRLTELEKAVVGLTVNVDTLTQAMNKSQEQITQQVILQTEILCTFKTAQNEIKMLSEGLNRQEVAILDLEKWKIQLDTNAIARRTWQTALLTIAIGVSTGVLLGFFK